MDKKNLLVIGSLNMDMVVNVKHMPRLGETIIGESFKTVEGGKGANQAFAAAKLGANVYMMGKVGMDDYGEALIDNLNRAGVNTDGIERQDDIHTGLAFIYVNSSGENNIVVIPGANNRCEKNFVNKYINLIRLCDTIVLQFEIPIDTVSHIIKIAKQLNKTIILDPAPVPKIIPNNILQNIDVITPNETELQDITGIKINSIGDIKKATDVLLSQGVKIVIVTLGNKGAIMAVNGKFKHFPTVDVKVIDTTAAGDSFTAAMATALLNNKTVEEAIMYANRVAAVVVTKEGAQSSIPTIDEIEEFYSKFSQADFI